MMVPDVRPMSWIDMPDRIDGVLAKAARDQVFGSVSRWLTGLLDYPGFLEWKKEVVRRQMVFALLPAAALEPFPDFEFDQATIREHEIVSGYLGLIGAADDCRTTQHYFRRYPFRDLPVGRAEHLRTCCEVYYSRVYQFRERLNRLIVRIARRTGPEKLNVDMLKNAFEAQFRQELDARHRIHHEAAYSDFELDALGSSDLLSNVDDAFPRMSDVDYRRIAGQWRRRVEITADGLDFWVGVVAVLLLVRCRFLPEPGRAGGPPAAT